MTYNEAKLYFSEDNDVIGYLNYILGIPEHPLPIYDSGDYMFFRKILSQDVNFLLWQNGDVLELMDLERFTKEEFEEFEKQFSLFFYCYKFKGVRKFIKPVNHLL